MSSNQRGLAGVGWAASSSLMLLHGRALQARFSLMQSPQTKGIGSDTYAADWTLLLGRAKYWAQARRQSAEEEGSR
jgi:hypothetical protein